MQTTSKYNEILKEAQANKPAAASNAVQHETPAFTKMDRTVLETEIKAMIKKAYETSETHNINS